LPAGSLPPGARTSNVPAAGARPTGSSPAGAGSSDAPPGQAPGAGSSDAPPGQTPGAGSGDAPPPGQAPQRDDESSLKSETTFPDKEQKPTLEEPDHPLD